MILDQIWRYPVKSMHGEQVAAAILTPHGLQHDRLYAFESPDAPPGMLRLPAQQRRGLLAFTARHTSVGATVTTPAGRTHPVDDPMLLEALPPGLRLTHQPTPQTDVRPLALISLQTIQHLAASLRIPLDPRRFRANLYLDLPAPFLEDTFPGRTLQIGAHASLRITERDPRCRFITYDPANPAADPLFALMKHLDRYHQTRAGIYASILTPGPIRAGDPITLLP